MPGAECESAVLRRPAPHRNPFRLESEKEDPADGNEKSGLATKREKPNQTTEQALTASRRRVIGRRGRLPLRWFRVQTGPGNRPFAPTGGGPSFTAILLTGRPFSGRRVNLGLREVFSEKIGWSDFGAPSRIHTAGGPWGFWRRVFGRPDLVLLVVSGANGARRSTIRADRRGPKIYGNPAHTSPDCGAMRKSGVPVSIFG